MRHLLCLVGALLVGCSGSQVHSDGGVLDLAASGGDLAKPAPAEPSGLTGITAAHNQVRATATPTPSPALPPLVWSSAVATTAQSWADGCQFKHSGGAYGENIFASAGSTPTGASVTASWASEASNYDYATSSCSGTCGHYTQIVWRQSVELGCGIASCSTNSPFSGFSSWTFVVCNYNPPGNSGGKPY